VVGVTARSGDRRRTVLTVLCLAQCMLIVDVVVVNVALPSIRADLGIAGSRLQLVAVGYTLTFGSLLSSSVGWVTCLADDASSSLGWRCSRSHRSPPDWRRPSCSSSPLAQLKALARRWCRPRPSHC
jgi:hypothetical protein